MKRRTFLGLSASMAGGLYLAGCESLDAMMGGSKVPFKISLAQWSWHRRLRGQQQPKMDNLDFIVNARLFGFEGVEYVNQFFMDKAQDRQWLTALKARCDDNGVRSLLIMCDREGNLGDPDDAARTTAVENHYKWVEAARFLGCHSIRAGRP